MTPLNSPPTLSAAVPNRPLTGMNAALRRRCRLEAFKQCACDAFATAVALVVFVALRGAL